MRTAAFALVLVAAACGSSGPTGVPQQIATSSTTADDARAIDSPVMRYQDTSAASGGLTTLLQGELQLDGDCLYLVQTSISKRTPILWPAGTHWDAPNKSVVAPSGAVMPIGGSVEGRGGFFFLTDIDRLAGASAWNLSVKCVDEGGQIAVVENEATAIGPTA